MTRQTNTKEILILENLEIKHKVLTLDDIEESVQKLKLDQENVELEQQFKCALCLRFSHDPINCSVCDFKACFKCFTNYKN